MVDPVGYCSCTPEEVKEKFLAKVKVNVAPGSLSVNVDKDQVCEKSADLGKLCTATINYLVTKPLGWDPEKPPKDPTVRRLSSVINCSARLVLLCDCYRVELPVLGWTLWSHYYWEYLPGLNPEVLRAEEVWEEEWWKIDPDMLRLRRYYNRILGYLSPGVGKWPAWTIDPYGVIAKGMGYYFIKSTEPESLFGGTYQHKEVYRKLWVDPKDKQAACVGG
jgi:hypothetical protein